MTMASGLWLGTAVVVFLGASTALRAHAGGAGIAVLIGALAFYTLGNFMMVRIMRENGMAVAISLSAVLQLIASSAIAVTVFGERPTGTQLTGIALGILAVVLIVLPAGRAP
jgi:small multidrug resistance pump